LFIFCFTFHFGRTVYELTQSNGSWSKSTILDFLPGDTGQDPEASLLIDASGTLYGTTLAGGQYQNGTEELHQFQGLRIPLES